ncbi:phage resistance protein [Naumannella sp. ID2617S]|nr:phage resistance protein [Naumannella sp. ID2617S]
MTTKLSDVIHIPTHAGADDYVLRLTDSVGDEVAQQTLDAYVVTDQLVDAFDAALGLVASALRDDESRGAFLTGSFGSGKSHFMAVLHALLRGSPAARSKPDLVPVVARHDPDLPGRTILPLAFHLLDSDSFEQAIFSGYLRQIHALHPEAPLPALHRSDGLLNDAARLRQTMGDDSFFAALNAEGTDDPWGDYVDTTWDADTFQAAVAAAPGSQARQQLIGDLVNVFFQNFTAGSDWIDLEQGLAVLAAHAQRLGYDAVVLFLDELVLWLAFLVQDRTRFTREAQKLTKLVESATGRRAIPLVSFIARQLDLRKWFADSGASGSEQEALEQGFRFQEGRFAQIPLGDDNLPNVAHKRLLAPIDAHAAQVLQDAFGELDRSPRVWDVLLDGINTDEEHRGSDEAAFRLTYPFSPALMSTLKSLASVMQRERTALKVMQQILVDRRESLTVADVIPVGDAYDYVVSGSHGQAIDLAVANLFKAADRLYTDKLHPMLLSTYGLGSEALEGAQLPAGYLADVRLAKTLLLSAVAPNVPALKDLDANRLAALNHGSITSPVPGGEAQAVSSKLRTWAQQVPEIHVEGAGRNPKVRLRVADVDYEGVIDDAKVYDSDDMQRQLVTQLLLAELGLGQLSQDATGAYRTSVVWRGSRRSVELVFGNVRDNQWLHNDSFRPAEAGAWRLVLDHPFDTVGHSPAEDLQRIDRLRTDGEQADTIVWVPHFLTDERHRELRRLVIIDSLLASEDRWQKHAARLSETDRPQARAILEQMREGLRSTLRAYLLQAYGITPERPGVLVARSESLLNSLNSAFDPGQPDGVDFRSAMDSLLDKALSAKWPAHPHFDPEDQEVRPADLRAVVGHLERAANDPTRRVRIEGDPRSLRRVANALEVGHAAETHFLFGDERFGAWGTELQRGLAQLGRSDTDSVTVAELRSVINALTPARGLLTPVADLVIHGWALLRQRAWYYRGAPIPAPAPGALQPEMELCAQQLPEQAVFTEAVRRAGVIFGISANPYLNPRAVTELAEDVRSRAAELEPAASALVAALEPVLRRLGQTGEVDRLRTARTAHQLVRRLAKLDGFELVQQLGANDLAGKPEILARSLSSADAVRTALGMISWTVIEAALEAAGTDTSASHRLNPLLRAVRTDEFTVGLAAAIRQANEGLLDWAVGRPGPKPGPAAPEPVPGGPGGPDQGPLPPPPDEASDQVFTVVARTGTDELITQLRSFVDEHPDDNIEVRWRLRER